MIIDNLKFCCMFFEHSNNITNSMRLSKCPYYENM